jgi:hypothetical protein
MAMPDSDDSLSDDPEFKQFADEFERHREALYQLVSDYMDEEGVSETFAAQLLLDATVHMRMAAYGTGVEHPSVGGLKLDLDRLRQEVDQFVREAKKGAEDYIREVKSLREEIEREEAEGAKGEGD